MKKYLSWIGAAGLLWSCNDFQEANLTSFDQRTEDAVDELRSFLLTPANGWRLDYVPHLGTGSYLVFLNFNDEGTVRIQSDLSANNGELLDQVVPYRIDSSQGLELIIETYTIFHYLFELDRSTFGGEFEFMFEEQDGDHLIFSSKTDNTGYVTVLTFRPAAAEESNEITVKAEGFLSQGVFQTFDLGGVGGFSTFNVYLPADDITISLTFDLDRRRLKIHGASEGQTMAEIIANGNGTNSGQTVMYSFANESVVLNTPVGISLNGNTYTLSEVPIENLTNLTGSFCVNQDYDLVRMTGSTVPGLGDIEITSSLFQTHSSFQPGTDQFYSINYPFIYNDQDISIGEEIEAIFPNVAVFQWYFGFRLGDNSLLNAIGFLTLDEFNNADFFLRGFDFVQNGNHIALTFNGEYFITDDNPTPEELDGLDNLTDRIFSGGEVYLLEVLPFDDLFEFYNPCNRYKGYIFDQS